MNNTDEQSAADPSGENKANEEQRKLWVEVKKIISEIEWYEATEDWRRVKELEKILSNYIIKPKDHG